MANRPHFLQYDIPEVPLLDAFGGPRWRFNALGIATATTRPVIPNPSDVLWGSGCVRITFSCWLVMEKNLHTVYPIMNNMSQSGVRWYCVPFDASAKADLRRMALENIQREIRERLENAATTRQEAETRLADESEPDFARRRRQYLAAARSIERRVTEMILRVQFAASEFEITPADLRTTEAVGEVELITSSMRQRAEAFAEAHDIARRAGKTNQARSLRRGEIPPPIFADLLEDEVDTDEAKEAASKLRATFGDFFDD